MTTSRRKLRIGDFLSLRLRMPPGTPEGFFPEIRRTARVMAELPPQDGNFCSRVGYEFMPPPAQVREATEKTNVIYTNSEYYWGTMRGKEVTAYSGTIPGSGDGFHVERYEAALVRRYGAPMLFKVTQLGNITAINGYDPEKMPDIPVAMMCVAKVKDLPEGEPTLGPPLSL